ncbi:hypothetical protein D3C78_1810610 [compost metagenome]
MGALEQSLALQLAQVAPDRGNGNAQPVAHDLHIGEQFGAQQFDQPGLPLTGRPEARAGALFKIGICFHAGLHDHLCDHLRSPYERKRSCQATS